MLSFALVTVFLFLMVIATLGEDDAGECFFWIIMFIVGSWFISIPILVIYICSAVQAIRHRDYMNNVLSWPLLFQCSSVTLRCDIE